MNETNGFTIGYWDKERDQFDVFAKIRCPQLDCPSLIIYPCTEQGIRQMLDVLQDKGFLKFEDGHYTVTEKGLQYHNQIHYILPGSQEIHHGS